MIILVALFIPVDGRMMRPFFDMLSLVLLGELGKNIKGFINSFSEFIRCIIFW